MKKTILVLFTLISLMSYKSQNITTEIDEIVNEITSELVDYKKHIIYHATIRF